MVESVVKHRASLAGVCALISLTAYKYYKYAYVRRTRVSDVATTTPSARFLDE